MDDTKIIKSQLFRFLQMYTTFNVFLVLMLPFLTDVLKDVVKANSLIVMFSISYFWLTMTNWKLYGDFYKSVPYAPKLNDKLRIFLSTLVDLTAHLLPVLLIGLPFAHPIFSVSVASLVFMMWYGVVRRDKKIQKIYVGTLPIESYDTVVSMGICFALLVAVFLEHRK